MQPSVPNDNDEVELSIRIHSIRKLKPFVSLFQKPSPAESKCSGSEIGRPISSALDNARVLVQCDLKPAQDTHSSSILPFDRGQIRASKYGTATTRWSAPSSRRTLRNDGEVIWSESGGILHWPVTRLDLKRLKSFVPKVKLQLYVMIKSHPSCDYSTSKAGEDQNTITSDETSLANTLDTSTSYWARRTVKPLGWVIIDVRDFDVTACDTSQTLEKNFKVNGGAAVGSEVKLTLTCLPKLLEPIQPCGINMTGQQHYDVTPFCTETEWVGSALPLGLGNSIFSFIVRLESAYCFDRLGVDQHATEGWLSYSLFDALVQTEKFPFVARPVFAPVEDTFRVRCSLQEIESYISEHCFLRMYLCTSKNLMLGHANIDLRPLVVDQGEKGKRELHGRFLVEAAGNKSTPSTTFESQEQPWIEVTVVLEQVSLYEGLYAFTDSPDNEIAINHREELSTYAKQAVDDKSALRNEINAPNIVSEALEYIACAKTFEEVQVQINPASGHEGINSRELKSATQVNKREDEFSNSQLKADIDKKRLEWEAWRHQQEVQWHEKLRSKEAAAMRALEERTRVKEKERTDAVEACRLEYSKLEAKLRKALVDIERREQQLVINEAARRDEFSCKVTVLESKHRAVVEEAKHSVNLEVC